MCNQCGVHMIMYVRDRFRIVYCCMLCYHVVMMMEAIHGIDEMTYVMFYVRYLVRVKQHSHV